MTAGPHALPFEKVLESAGVDPAIGLDPSEVEERRRRFGSNVVDRESSRSLAAIFVRQFASLVILLLAGAAAIAFGTGDHLEGAAILAVLLLNAMIGATIEWQSERALAKLRLQAEISARVVRGGQETILPAAEVVVGDVVVLEAGSRVPADARLIEAVALEIEESALTGESTPVEKTLPPVPAGAALPDRSNMSFLGTSVTSGRARAVVIAVGEQTELGRIGQLVRATPRESTPLEKTLASLGKRLVHLVLGIAVAVVVAGLLRGEPLWAMVEFAISLAVAAVPEGLPAVTTLVLALGVLRMARRHAVVRRLPAVETLGGTTVICTDKTGTLTQNRLAVREIEAADPVRVLTIATLCNDAIAGEEQSIGDPTEVAILRAARERGIDVIQLRASHPRIEERAFDHKMRRMITVHHTPDGTRLAALKGAPRAVVERCAMPDTTAAQLLENNHALAARGLRVLGVAEQTLTEGSDLESGYTFLGFLAMSDPPREDAAAAVLRARQARVRVVMLTGDQPETARAIASELRLAGDDAPRVLHARDLAGHDVGLRAEGLIDLVRHTDVFARVSPSEKLQIVEALRDAGEIVAVTGDGINDAPALRRAHIGIAMGRSGTDVARQSADLVLTDDNLGTIVDAIEEGRTIFANIQKFVHAMFSHNLAEVLTVFAALATATPLPLLPLQILWVNLVTDVFPAFALAMEPRNADDTRKPPRPAESLLSRNFIVLVLWQGALLAGLTFGAYLWALQRYGDDAHARSIALTALVAVQVGHLFNCRSRTRSAFVGLLRNPFIWASTALVAALQIAAVSFGPLMRVLRLVPLTAADWIVVAICCALPIAVVEPVKAISRRRFDRLAA